MNLPTRIEEDLGNPAPSKYGDVDLKSLIGKYVRKAFFAWVPEQKKTMLEFMWVKVDEVKGRLIYGSLKSRPRLAKNFGVGARIALEAWEIDEIKEAQ